MNNEPIISGTAICDYIPQRPPIVMIDKFFGLTSDASQSGLTISPDNLFCCDGKFQDGGIVEHIAQSGAMHIGFEFISRGEKVPLGFIGSINKLKINRLPSIGEELRTSICIEAKVGEISLIKATVSVGDEVIAEGKMKVATQPQ